MNNVINWFELPVNDFSRARAFYENVLEISLTEMELDGFKSLTFPFDGFSDIYKESKVKQIASSSIFLILLYKANFDDAHFFKRFI